jgi:hypothetical protein
MGVNCACQPSLIGIEKAHPDDGGSFEHGADRTAGVALLDPLYKAAGQAGPLRQLPGGDFLFNARPSDDLAQEHSRIPAVPGMGVQSGFCHGTLRMFYKRIV